ncbi:MAG TPA: cupredoxin domain-containing protein [Solirubrobacterales bacterium]|jgi:plastocyanin|nr:cupredoxin domain-containing protein [Solirubrobacterales bacterium]
MRLTGPSVSRLFLGGLAVGAIALALVSLESAPAAGDDAAQASRTARASRAKTVNMPDLTYIPQTLTVAAGTKVTFVNSSKTLHTATRAGSFDTGVIHPGHSASVRFTHRGTFAYVCTVHPKMKGKIVVK